MFEQKFEYPKTIKKNKDSEFENMAYATFCVMVVESLLKDKFILETKKNDKDIYFKFEKKNQKVKPKKTLKKINPMKVKGVE